MSKQTGFTLLEVMVAMVIFAMLAVLGWQVFDSLNKANDRAKIHADNLAQLQYAYLQVQNDMGQITAWSNKKQTKSENQQAKNNQQKSPITPYQTPNFLQLKSNSLSFIRFADPDPRYQTSPSLIRVEYLFNNKQFIRRQFIENPLNANNSTENSPMQSVLLTNIDKVKLQALLPEPTNEFANGKSGQGEEKLLLPKGIAIDFDYHGQAINWRFALKKSAPSVAN
ncbi:MAG: prepilin-type N-terminal cleavage/methylation domain-containing protein [Moraxellaceae bacterium]|nr:prepilin-type N-terminal cleavage/methylation domain-containing protein [Moraxellaceae bacterium]